MVKHSEALTSWNYIWDSTFPFNKTIKAGSYHAHILAVYRYFKKLRDTRQTEGYKQTGHLFLTSIAPHIPHDRVNIHYKILLEYFSQILNYTPINTKTGTKLFV